MTSHVHLIAFGILHSIRKTTVTMSEKSSRWCLFWAGISWAVGGLILDVQASWLVGGMQRSSGSVNHAAGSLCEQKRKSLVPLSSSRHELLGSCHHFWVLVRDVSLHWLQKKKRGPTCFHLICSLLLFEFPFKISLGLPSILGGLYIPCSCLHARLHGASWTLWYLQLSNDLHSLGRGW